MKTIIQSKKHILQISQSAITQGAVLITNVASAIEGAPTTPTTISEGAIVKAVWVEMWLNNDSATLVGSFTAGFYKNPGDANPINATTAAALHDWSNKKNLFYTTQGLAPATDSALMLLYKGWIKIPKGKQRMGLGDKLQFFVRNNNATAVDIDICGLFIFKEYT